MPPRIWPAVGLDGWRVAPRGRPDRASLVAGCGDSRARHRWHGIGGYAARNACRPAAAAGARRQWLPTVSGCMASRRACSCSTRRRTCRNSYVRCPGSNPPLLICMCCLDRFCCRERWATRNGWAQMEAVGARRTVGSISQVRLSAPAAFMPPAWLPADASLKLDFEIHEDGRRVREQIWRSALSPRRAQARRSVACATRVGAPREFRQARRSAGNGTTRHCNGPRPRWNRAARHMDQELDTMKTLLMRAWRRFGAYGLALAAALATAWAVREHMSDKARRAGGGQRARCRTTGRGRGPGGARGWTNRTCSDGRFPRPGRPVPAWIRWRRKHCWARCCQRISMRARSSCRHICWANPPGERRRRLRRSLHCQQECAP